MFKFTGRILGYNKKVTTSTNALPSIDVQETTAQQAASSTAEPQTLDIVADTQDKEATLTAKLQAIKTPIKDKEILVKILRSDDTSSVITLKDIDFSGVNMSLFSNALAACILNKTIAFKNVTLNQYQFEQLYKNLEANIIKYSDLKQGDTLINGISHVNISDIAAFLSFFDQIPQQKDRCATAERKLSETTTLHAVENSTSSKKIPIQVITQTKFPAIVKFCSDQNLLSQDEWLSIYETVSKEVAGYARHYEKFLHVCYEALLNKFRADLDSSTVEKFLIEHADEYNDEVLDILLARAKTIEPHDADYQNNDYFNAYWNPILTHLTRDNKWDRLKAFIDALPYHTHYTKFIGGISDTRCQQALFEKTGWNISEDGEINFVTAPFIAEEKAKTGDAIFVDKIATALDRLKGKKEGRKALLWHAINNDSPKLIQILHEKKPLKNETWNKIREEIFNHQPKSWKVLEYCLQQQLSLDEKNNPATVQFWTQKILGAAIDEQQWSCANTIIASFPYQEGYKTFYGNVTDVECQKAFQKSAGWSVEEKGPMPSSDSLNNDHVDIIVEYLTTTKKLGIDVQEKVIKKVLSSNEFCLLAKTLVDNDVIGEAHIEKITTWIVRKLNQSDINYKGDSTKGNNSPYANSENFTPNQGNFENDHRSIPLMESIAQKEVFMRNNVIKSLCNNRVLNIAINKDYKKLTNILLNHIFLAVIEHSADLSTEDGQKSVEQLKQSLAKIRLFGVKNDKDTVNYIERIKTLQSYVESALKAPAPQPKKNGSLYSKSKPNKMEDHNTGEKVAALYQLFQMLQSSTNSDLGPEAQKSALEDFDRLADSLAEINKTTRSLRR